MVVTEPLYGQCKCGGPLTVNHLRNHCPLRPQPNDPLNEAALEAMCRVVLASRLDTTGVAVLGEN